MSPLTLAVSLFLCLVVGFGVGVFVSNTVLNGVHTLRDGIQTAFNGVSGDMRDFHERLVKLESKLKDDIATVAN